MIVKGASNYQLTENKETGTFQNQNIVSKRRAHFLSACVFHLNKRLAASLSTYAAISAHGIRNTGGVNNYGLEHSLPWWVNRLFSKAQGSRWLDIVNANSLVFFLASFNRLLRRGSRFGRCSCSSRSPGTRRRFERQSNWIMHKCEVRETIKLDRAQMWGERGNQAK